jgi:tetratricopeptide (TPR) repeat protein
VWRTRSVFISSTFLDMQEERDFLRTRAFLELEELLRARRCHLEWVDLRLGVATSATSEGARELQVLKVCLDEVRRCRPFLIILLGDRYGWVPPVDSIGAAAREQGLPADVAGRSVTDLEIEFGIFADPGQQTRSFFYFREPLPYAAMPPAIARLYSDANCDDADAQARVDRLATLKSRIERTLPARVRHYQAAWDPVKQRVAGLEALGRMVLADIWAELDAETAAAADVELSWQQTERQALDDFIEDRARDFLGRQQAIAELEKVASSAVSDRAVWGCCVEGAAGSGKSALFGALCRRLRETDALVLAHSAGASVRSASVDAMLLRWIGELADALGVEAGVTETSGPNSIDATFASLLGRMTERRRVIVMVDALDQFENTPRGRFATWLPPQWPRNARLLATAIPGPGSEALAERARFGTLALPPLDAIEATSIARSICARYHRELDGEVYDALRAKRGAAAPAWGNPLWLVLAVEDLNLLDADDFARAQRDYTGDPATRLRALMVDTVAAYSTDIAGLFARMFERAEEIFGVGIVRAFLGLIAVGRAGWRESDFRAVVPGLSGEDWDELRFASLRRLFRGQIRQRGALMRWDVSHNQMRIAIQQHLARHGIAEAFVHAAIANHLLSYPQHDPLRISETMVHLLGSGDVTRAANYYTDDLASDERDGAMAAVRDHLLLAADPQAAAQQIAALVDAPGLDPDRRIRAAEFHVLALASQLESRAPIAVRLVVLERAAKVLETAAQRDGADAATKLSLAVTQNTIAAMLLASGRSDAALRAFQQSIATAETTPDGDVTENIQRDYGLARSFEGIGDLHLAAGRLSEAQANFQKALAIREKLLAAAPDDPERSLALSVALSKLGETQLIAAEPDEALATFQRCLATTQRLLSANPADVVLRGKLANYYERTGIAHSQKGDDAAAFEAMRHCYEIRTALAAADPADNELQGALQSCAIGLGEILVRHRPMDALDLYQMAFRISQKLLAADPNNDFFLRGGLMAHFGIGKCFAGAGMRDDAIKAFRRCVEVAERLARSSPDNIVWQMDLADSLYRAALCGDFPKARLTSALAILQRMQTDGKLTPVSRNLKISIERSLEDLKTGGKTN